MDKQEEDEIKGAKNIADVLKRISGNAIKCYCGKRQGRSFALE